MKDSPKTLLILEDDAGLCTTMVECAASLGYEVFDSPKADEGLKLAQTFRPTMVFIDVHLAKGDGRKVLAALRADPATRDCQVVIMTGDWVGAPQSEATALAADAYLAKPFTLDEYLACLEERYAQANL